MAHATEQLVGRVAELEALERSLVALERRQPSRGRADGRAGHRQDADARRARRGAPTRAATSCSRAARRELERELPFSVFVDALDDYVQALEPRRLDMLDDDARAELGAGAAVAAARAARAPGERYRAHRAVRQLLECVAATKPLVLLLDDLHWADDGSIELLGALLRRPPAAAVLIALAVRPRQAARAAVGGARAGRPRRHARRASTLAS